MKILLFGFIIFSVAFFLHIIIWKIHLPKKQRKALLEIFFITLIVGLCILRGLSIREYVQLCMFFLSLILAYIATYSGIEVDSPSLEIILNIANASSKGLTKDTLLITMTDEYLVLPRIKDLLVDNRIYLDNSKYKLTNRGHLLARIFIFYRKLLRLNKGG